MSHRLWTHRITDVLDSIKKIQLYVVDMEFDDYGCPSGLKALNAAGETDVKKWKTWEHELVDKLCFSYHFRQSL